jgi:asparagine synthase (glutamine-hydrolysing)
MSVQFGKCNFDGKPVDAHDLEEARAALAAYGPDGESCFCQDNVGVLYRAFHTTREARRETQPHISRSGVVVTWDGRLDNRKYLIERLAGELSLDSTDLEIAAAAYDRWGTDTFQELIGDWALSAWNSKDQSLVLAKDVVGTRHLYYLLQHEQIRWCTILDPLVLSAEYPLKLEEEYVAGWLSFFPATHLTPYGGIHAVPPASFVRLKRGMQKVTKYWDFDPSKRIRYRTDGEYEEHFRAVFAEAVRRRLRSDSPVLAELSGGMDSSSIVCMADEILRRSETEAPLLETVSYYNDSEPNWDERPYFEKVEAKRGRTGLHINVGAERNVEGNELNCPFPVTPASGEAVDQAVARFLISSGCRVLLSGTGGDEVTGGVPTPLPELADLLARAQLRQLARQLKVWALNKRIPWFHLFFGSARRFLPTTLLRTPSHKLPAPWLDSGFVKRSRKALRGYETRLTVFGPLPSFQENITALDGLRRQLACERQTPLPCVEKTYPYLDRDLLEFLYAVPREQLLRPGQRRSLMRRALVGIVPDEILNRRRKAYVTRAPLAAVADDWAHLRKTGAILASSELGIVDQQRLARTIEQAHQGHEVPMVSLMRTIAVETWLRQVRARSIGPATSNEAETRQARSSSGKASEHSHFAAQPCQTGEP